MTETCAGDYMYVSDVASRTCKSSKYWLNRPFCLRTCLVLTVQRKAEKLLRPILGRTQKMSEQGRPDGHFTADCNTVPARKQSNWSFLIHHFLVCAQLSIVAFVSSYSPLDGPTQSSKKYGRLNKVELYFQSLVGLEV